MGVKFSSTLNSASSDREVIEGKRYGGALDLVGQKSRGYASYYADKFVGRTTANGEIFSNTEMTAAHKTLAFGTMVQVTNLTNGRKTIVRINDRGPFVDGRIIDLSKEAAKVLGMIQQGVIEVEIEIVE